MLLPGVSGCDEERARATLWLCKKAPHVHDTKCVVIDLLLKSLQQRGGADWLKVAESFTTEA